MDTNKPGSANPNEGVLANFFNSLLHKKIGSPRGASKFMLKIIKK